MGEHTRALEKGSYDECRQCQEPWPCKAGYAQLERDLAAAREQLHRLTEHLESIRDFTDEPFAHSTADAALAQPASHAD